ncbi:NAD-dependent succinate-semialdehyde dehydrogenase, partial [Sandarakinorhabdus sp.]|uniref:NAD-dependent succinate-semialdehyde dehydrogenase n=1 Tax=Sandarakinorhabdus sp. TaxID=1916663 RepID=UPI00334047CF
MTSEYTAQLALVIGGEWIAAGSRDTHSVINPATGGVIGELPLASPADLDRALAAAAHGFVIWRAASADERGAVLAGAARLLRERGEHIAAIATLEQGKPLAEARAEVGYAAALVDFYAGEAKRAYGRVLVRPRGSRSLVLREPIGPAAAFCPWNFPILNPARKLAPALAAGCSMIVKPPEEAPGSALAVARCFLDAGVPPEVIGVVFGVPDQVSRHLIASPVIRKISFTGSVPVGKHLMTLAAQSMKRTTMELGGHSPVLVFDDCDLEKTIAMVSAFKFRNAGQVCVSPTRFYVQEGIYDRFVAGFAARADALTVGSGLDPATTMGPLANRRRPDAIEALVADAKTAGARVAAGGQRGGGQHSGKTGFFFQPTVLTDVPDTARAMNEEPFGPLALVQPFRAIDDAIVQANRLPFGLAAYCFTENARRANVLGDAIEAGMIGINTMGMSHVDAPFGGVKDSGHGSEDGPEGM